MGHRLLPKALFLCFMLMAVSTIMAHQDIQSPYRVGRYGVDVEAIDSTAVPSLTPQSPDHVVVIDEIGKMEFFSDQFRDAIIRTLNAPNPVIGTISLKGGRFIQPIKDRPDVTLVTVDRNNRDELAEKRGLKLSGK